MTRILAVLTVLLGASSVAFASGPTIEWMPVAASDNVICLPGEGGCGDREIFLSAGGATVTFFLQVAGWDPDQDGDPLLGLYQGTVHPMTYEGGLGPGVAEPTHPGNPGTVSGVDLQPVGAGSGMHALGAFQALRICTMDTSDPIANADWLSRCETDSDCPPFPAGCIERPDYVFYGMEHTSAVIINPPALLLYTFWGDSPICRVDPDGVTRFYAGTLLLEVPAEAVGTYNLGFYDCNGGHTLFYRCERPIIPYLTCDLGRITIATGRCCSNIGEGTTMCEDELTASECDARPGPRAFVPFESCDTGHDCNGNGVPDECDILVADCNNNAIPDDCEPDGDSDGVIDVCDGCPDDPNKTAPGVCGCGVPYTDADCDGVPDAEDQCPGMDDTLYAPDCEEAVPTMSQWGLVVMVLLLGVVGTIQFGHRLSRRRMT
ncbi:MAG: hypothetical protein ACYTFA_04885 [Planctomycetota bacterium]|jgi:hypothetical protein